MTEETLHKAQDEGARTTREPLTTNRILPAETVQAFHVFGGYILGFVTMELSQAFELGEENHRRAHEEFARGVPPEQLPRLTESLPYFADCGLPAGVGFRW